MESDQFALDITIPNEKTKRYQITNKLAVGTSQKCKINITGHDLAPIHCLFTVVNGVLTVHNNSGEKRTSLQGKSLETGKKYVVDDGDKIILGKDIKIIIRVIKQEKLPDNTLIRNLFSEEDSSSDIEKESPLKASPKVQEEENKDKSNSSIESNTPQKISEESPRQSKTFLESLSSIINLKTPKKNEKTPKKQNEKEADEQKLFSSRKGENSSQYTRPSFNFKKSDLNEDQEVPTPSIQPSELSSIDSPGLIPRFSSIIANISLTYLLISEFSLKAPPFLTKTITKNTQSFLQLDKTKELLSDNVIKKLSDTVFSESIIEFVLTLIGLELVQTLIFGMTLPLLLFGVKVKGNFLLKRILGVSRYILGLILFPFIIFDLPALIKRPTLKEVITLTRYSFSSTFLKYTGLIWAIFLTLLPVEIPLLQNYTSIQKTIEQKRISFTRENSSFIHIDLFGFQTKTNLENYTIIPRPGRGRKSPITVNFYSKELEDKVRVQKIKTVKSLQVLKDFSQDNIFFSKVNPVFSDFLTGKKDSFEGTRELENIFLQSFSISPESVLKVTLDQGPIFSKLFEFRSKMEKNLNLSTNYELTILKGKHHFIFQFIENKKHTLAVIEGLNVHIYEIKEGKKSDTVHALIKDLFANSSFTEKLKAKGQSIQGLTIGEYLHQYKFNSPSPKESEIQEISNYYKELLVTEASTDKLAREIRAYTKEIISLISSLPNNKSAMETKSFQELVLMGAEN